MSVSLNFSAPVVAAVDAARPARDAAVLAAALCGAGGGPSAPVPLLLATVVAESRLPLPAALRRDDAGAAREQLEAALAALGADCAPTAQARVVAARSVARGLHELAERERARLVVIGSSRGADPGRALAGRSARQLLHGAPFAVALAARGLEPRPAGGGTAGGRTAGGGTAGGGAATPFALRRIAVGADGSPEAAAALATARELATRSGATVHVVAVADEALGLSRAPLGELAELAAWDELVTQRREHAQRILDDALARLEGAGGAAPAAGDSAASDFAPAGGAVTATGEVRVGDPPQQLAEAAAGADLLVLGSRQWGALAQVVIGSTAEELLRGAPCSLLLVPRPRAEAGSG